MPTFFFHSILSEHICLSDVFGMSDVIISVFATTSCMYGIYSRVRQSEHQFVQVNTETDYIQFVSWYLYSAFLLLILFNRKTSFLRQLNNEPMHTETEVEKYYLYKNFTTSLSLRKRRLYDQIKRMIRKRPAVEILIPLKNESQI